MDFALTIRAPLLSLVATARRREVSVPSPSWPELFAPQHQTAEVDPLMAQVNAPPAVMAVLLVSVAPPATLTTTALVLDFLVPSPSCPEALSPQQYAFPLATRAQVCL
jgi:hypothetical protein